MNRNNETKEPIKRSRIKLAWLLGATATISVLLYWELLGLLYVGATFAMCALFIVVAFSNLKTGLSETDGKEG